MRYLALLFVVLSIGAVLVWGCSRIVSSPAMYQSMHAMGYRAGTVLPSGRDEGSQRSSVQFVRVSQRAGTIELSHPDRPAASIRSRLKKPTDTAWALSSGIDRVLVTLLVVVCIVGALLCAARMRDFTQQDNTSPADRKRIGSRVLRAGVMVLPVGLVIASMFVLMRIFWTGVDDSFIARSTQINPGSSTTRVLGDTTLAMNMPELLMLYLAVVLTAFPMMLLIAVYAMGDSSGLRACWSRSRVASPLRGLLEIRAVQARLNTHSMLSVTAICYLLTIMALWSAPYSTTLARAMWSW